MFDFQTGIWSRDPNVLIETLTVPGDLASRTHLSLNSPGIAVLFYQRGGSRIAGLGGESATPIEPGDQLVLLVDEPVQIPLQIAGLQNQNDDPVSVSFRASLGISDPVKLASVFSTSVDDTFTRQDVANHISRDSGIRLGTQQALSGQQGELPGRLAQTLAHPLDLLLGLTLRNEPEDVQVRAGHGLVSQLEPDAIVGQWKAIERLGRGSFGEVWRVEHTELDGLVRAMKVVNHSELARAVNREVRRLVELDNADIDYRNLARLMEIIPGDPPVLLYELVHGPTLVEFVEQQGGTLDRETARAIALQILSGLDQIHRAGLVHRDLHPGNVIVTGSASDPRIKILDLGLAWPIEPDQMGMSTARSILGIEPGHPFAERMHQRASPIPDSRTDIYSAGVLLWWMLTGQPGLPPGQSLSQAAPGGDAGLFRIVEKATAVNRDQRYVSADDMAEALRNANQPELVETTPKAAVAAPPPASNGPGRFVPIGLAALIIIALIAALATTDAGNSLIAGVTGDGDDDQADVVAAEPTAQPASDSDDIADSETVESQVATSDDADDSMVAAAEPTDVPPTPAPEPTVAPSPAPSPTPVPEPTSAPPPTQGTVVYEADWSDGFDGWTATQDWNVTSGMLVSDGSHEIGIATAPIDLDHLDDYTIEAEIQVVRLRDAIEQGEGRSAGIIARTHYHLGIFYITSTVNPRHMELALISEREDLLNVDHPWASAINQNLQSTVAFEAFEASADWQQYRAEVVGNSLTLYIDDHEVAAGTDNRFLDPGDVGVYSRDTQVSIRNFTVIAD